MSAPFFLQSLAESVVAAILISLATGIPLAALTAGILMAGRQNSARRFAAWYATLILIALLPLIWVGRSAAIASVTSGPAHPLITLPASCAGIALAAWGVLALGGFLRVAVGLARVIKLRRSCSLVDIKSLDPVIQKTLAEMNSGRRTLLCSSDSLRVPTAIGFFQPRVILPSWVLQELSTDQIRPLLLHELAHIRRWDDWTNLLQKLLQAIFFFHPAVWWIEKRIALEREMACDDVVLARTVNPAVYAGCLLAVAEKSFMRRGFSMAQAAVNRMRQTSARITQILNSEILISKTRAGVRTRNAAAYLLAVPAVLTFALLTHSAQLVAFRDQIPVASDASRVSSTEASKSGSLAPPVPGKVRSMVSKPSLRPRVALASTPADLRNVSTGKVIQAKLLQNARPPASREINAEGNNRSFLTQTVYVVMNTRTDAGYSEFWTVRVWRLTVFRPAVAPPNPLPTRKL